jgi:prevent-host-death family protein
MTSNATKSSKPMDADNRAVPKVGKVRRSAASDLAQTSSSSVRPGWSPRSNSATASSVSSTKAKSAFGRLIQQAKLGPVFVTTHNKREAVVLSVDDYEQLLANQRDPLADMADHFDALVAKMQTPEFVAGVDAFFDSTPEQLGDSAAKAARGG